MKETNTNTLLENIENLSLYMHQTSTRPCPACLAMSRSLGYYFGCYDLIKRTGKGTLPGLITTQSNR